MRARGRAIAVLLGACLACSARVHVAADPPRPAEQVSAAFGGVCLFRSRTVTCISEIRGRSTLADVDAVPMPQFTAANYPCAYVGDSLRCLYPPSGWETLPSPPEGFILREYDGRLFLGHDAIASPARETVSYQVVAIPGLTDAVSNAFLVVAIAGGRLGTLDFGGGDPVWRSIGEYPGNSRLVGLSTPDLRFRPLLWAPGSTRLLWFRDGLESAPQTLEAPAPPVTVVGNSWAPAVCVLDAAGQVACANDGGLRCEPDYERAFSAIGLPGIATSIAVGQSHACALVDGDVYCWGRLDSTPGCWARPTLVRFDEDRADASR